MQMGSVNVSLRLRIRAQLKLVLRVARTAASISRWLVLWADTAFLNVRFVKLRK